MNHKNQIQKYEENSVICGPCVIEFAKQISNKSIEEITNDDVKKKIYENIVINISKKLKNSEIAKSQFVDEYSNVIENTCENTQNNVKKNEQANNAKNYKNTSNNLKGDETGYGKVNKQNVPKWKLMFQKIYKKYSTNMKPKNPTELKRYNNNDSNQLEKN